MKNFFKCHKNEVKTILIVFMLAIVFETVIILFSFITPFQNDPTLKTNYITVSSAVIGGLCTLVGVIITINFNKDSESKRKKAENRPNIFIPSLYDRYKATYVRLTSNMPKNRSTNRKVYFKNTDKAPFSIHSIAVNNDLLTPETITFVDKGELVCLSFYQKSDFDELTLIIKSCDNNFYHYRFLFENNEVLKMLEMDK